MYMQVKSENSSLEISVSILYTCNMNLFSTHSKSIHVFCLTDMSSQIQLLLLTCSDGDCTKPEIWISPLGSNTVSNFF